jgi:hypothetical protein
LSVGLLDKTLVDEVWVAKAFWVEGFLGRRLSGSPRLLSFSLLPIPILHAAHFYPPKYLSNYLHVRWHFGCRTEREQGCIFGRGANHEIESSTAMIDPARRSAVQGIEMALKSWGMPMCCLCARAANFAWETL